MKGTARRAPTEEYRNSSLEKFGQPTKGSLATIIGAFKSAVTKRINLIRNSSGITFWQRNFYERIIRYEYELYFIREYIKDNPLNWNNHKY